MTKNHVWIIWWVLAFSIAAALVLIYAMLPRHECSLEEDVINLYRETIGAHELHCDEDLRESAEMRARKIHDGVDEWSHDGYTGHISVYYRGGGRWGRTWRGTTITMPT